MTAVPAAMPVRANRRAVAALAVAALVIVLADVLTKYLVVARLSDQPPLRLLGGAVYFTLTRNSGAAFSLGTHLTFVFPVVSGFPARLPCCPHSTRR